LVCVETPGKTYWKNWFGLLKKEFLKGGYITKDDFNFFKIVHSVKDAVDEITNFYKNYHSIRFGRGCTIIRLNRKLPEKALNKLSKKYSSILKSAIKPSGPLPAEVREKEFLDLPRICFGFDRRSYNVLIELVRDLNKI